MAEQRGYQPLECHELSTNTFLNARFVPWRINLMAFSKQDPDILYVAEYDIIKCFRVNQVTAFDTLISSEGQRSPINAIHVGSLGAMEVLVTASDRGPVRVWFTNLDSDLHRTPISLQPDESAWGIATHAEHHLVAVSTNAHTITVWNLEADKREWLGEGCDKLVLRGHAHNVPNIDFSPCGRYLVSCSIDKSCKVWYLKSGDLVFSSNVTSQWGWTARFVSLLSFKPVKTSPNPNSTVLADILFPNNPFPTMQRSVGRTRSTDTSLNEVDYAEDFGDLEEDDSSIDVAWNQDVDSLPDTEIAEEDDHHITAAGIIPDFDTDNTEAGINHEDADDSSLASTESAHTPDQESEESDVPEYNTTEYSPSPYTIYMEQNEHECELDSSTDAILFTSANHLVLLSTEGLNRLYFSSDVLSRNFTGPRILSPYLEAFDRLCFSEWVDELSCGFVGSQCGVVAIIRGLRGAKFQIKDTKSGTNYEVSSSTDKPAAFVIIPRGVKNESLTVLDNRTGKIYEIPIQNGTVNATQFQRITDGGSEGIRVFDAGYQNTAVAYSKICEIDGDNGILRYRGYPIEELAEKSNYMEVSYLLIYGELPTKAQYTAWVSDVQKHTFVHSKLETLMSSFTHDAHPMGMFMSSIAALGTFAPDGNPALQGSDIFKDNIRARNKQVIRLLGKSTTLAAMAYRNRIGRNFNPPRNDLTYTENFLYQLDHLAEPNYKPNPRLARALDVLFILHADHEMNCSTAAMRHIGSSLVDPYSAVTGAIAALYGPLHGGANEAVLRMLEEIGTVDNVPAFVEGVKNRKRKLMGFGHRVYKNYDPRAKIVRQVAYEVFDIVGREPLIDVALALEKTALSDPFFIERKLYPNVDFYSGKYSKSATHLKTSTYCLIYRAIGFPTDFYPVLFAIPRVAGWLAHWCEAMDEKDGKIWRPRQVYIGEGKRSYVSMQDRGNSSELNPRTLSLGSISSKRSSVASWDGKKAV
ncbi:hypothetical protein SmJEL517_g02651 [Synchytrium microbalum]|uniref:Citrate synthase n=1 Tax=Synchytrium microbalum TaxID=1806994 RepID=A0A507C018_9FUNG|nr:uncharacterized protein SmJEL517_g02651 [Synchytrium microbalum]TPX34870.1 hypothetical protein SmJEL517_g02651 [Synchytrium microbalum]